MFKKVKDEDLAPPSAEDKKLKYEEGLSDLNYFFTNKSTTENRLSFEAKMVITSAAIAAKFDDLIFCGYYVVKNLLDAEGKPLEKKILEIGPYQSKVLATPIIEIGKGVCGTCWEEKATQIVEDVRSCKNYIACDGKTRSEIVLPVFKSREDKTEVIAVLDIDSGLIKRFDKVDQEYLEKYIDYLYA